MKLRRIALFFSQIVVVGFIVFIMTCANASDIVGDIDRDGNVGLKEAIYALQVTAGMKPEFGEQYSALGTYTYNSSSGVLTTNFTSSTFPSGEGPTLGGEALTVSSVTATSMVMTPADGDNSAMEWTRSTGVAGDITGTWEFFEAERKNTFILTIGPDGSIRMDGYIVDYHETFEVPFKTISIDGLFSDWTDSELVYEDTDGPDCDNVAGRDIVRVYAAQDSQFIYLRMDLNGTPDPTYGYKFGSWLHLYVGTPSNIFIATPLSCSISDETASISFDANRFECRFDKCLVSHWNTADIAAWCDQGTETICRDYIELPVMKFDFSSCACNDDDSDGYYTRSGCTGSLGLDCNDAVASIHPGAEEICSDGIDNDCDGVIDEDCTDTDQDGILDRNDNCIYVANAGQEDSDGDGIGDVCDPCNAVTEVCDGIDNDCDGVTDENCTDVDHDGIFDMYDNCIYTANPGQEDSDGDGIGDACTEVCGDYVDNDGDGMTDEDCVEICGDGVDNDGDGATDELCPEICNDGIDNDHDGITDEGECTP